MLTPEKPICPLVVADRIRSIHHEEFMEITTQVEKCPRLVELLWFIQWWSNQPGGLKKLTEQCMADSPKAFDVRKALVKAGATPKDFESIIGVPQGVKAELIRAKGDMSSPDVLDACRENALREMPRYLSALCQWNNMPFHGRDRSRHDHNYDFDDVVTAWYVDDIFTVLFAFMDRHAERECGRLVKTEIFRTCEEAFEYALAVRDLVTLEGDPRFGKTVCFESLCRARPGLMRKVTIPSSDTRSDLHKAMADAFYLNVSFNGRLTSVREPVEFILKHGGIGIATDESHFLIPASVSDKTRPKCLNWFREAVVDRGVPCVFSCTPQQYHEHIDHMVKVTKYQIPQWLGRPAMEYHLPESVSDADMAALVRHHLGELSAALVKKIAGRATGSHAYLKGIENVAKRARFLSQREGLEMTEKLIERAMNDVLPSAVRQTLAPAATSIASAAANPLPLPLPATANRNSTAAPRQPRSGTRAAAMPPQGEASAPRFLTEQLATQADD